MAPSIRVYLTEGVRSKEYFEEQPQYDRRDGSKWIKYRLSGGISLLQEGDRLYFSLDMGDPIPPFTEDVVEEVSLYDYFSTFPTRARGVYKYKDATAQLDLPGTNYILQIRGRCLTNVVDLYHQIRAGIILPTESWEAKQTSRRAIWEKVLVALRLKRTNTP